MPIREDDDNDLLMRCFNIVVGLVVQSFDIVSVIRNRQYTFATNGLVLKMFETLDTKVLTMDLDTVTPV